MKINWNFLGGGGCKIKKTFCDVGGVWISSGTVETYRFQVLMWKLIIN